MRKMAALAVMPLGLAVLALAVAVLIQHGLSLPAPSVQTEGQWAAYQLHRWAFLLGEVPLGLGIFLAGYLLWPGRLVGDSLARLLAIVGPLVALAGSSGRHTPGRAGCPGHHGGTQASRATARCQSGIT